MSRRTRGRLAKARHRGALRAFAAALWWLAAARVWHARHSFGACVARLRRPVEGASGAAPDPVLMLWALEAAGKRVPWRADCVVQALAAKFWLERAGVASDLRLGAQAGASGPQMHAWLEVEGRAVSGGAGSGDLARFEAAGGGDDGARAGAAAED